VPADAAAARITSRGARAGILIPPGIAERLDAYLQLLAKWNKGINLTSLPIDPPSDDAIDRLLVEPLAATSRLLASDRLAIDIGSGGGSPAIPIKIAAPALRMILVESRTKKESFLREAVRRLELRGVEVANQRLEELATRVDLQGAADVLTLRAVTATHALWTSIDALLASSGRVFWFGGKLDSPEARLAESMRGMKADVVRTPPNSQLLIFRQSVKATGQRP
jgi:16S rRNA (guanine527-N7)-methyltransferase